MDMLFLGIALNLIIFLITVILKELSGSNASHKPTDKSNTN